MDERRTRVLLVEDDEDDFVLVRDYLAEIPGDGYSLDWIPDPETALTVIARDEHDVVLIDYRLGGRNGLDLVEEAIVAGYKAPLILLTGQGGLELDIQAMQLGASDYLAKGRFDARQLERSLRYAIWHRDSQEALRRARDE
ncbi:response regulator, partial [Singulisphaera rosea]